MNLHPIRAAYQRGLTTGRQQATREAVDHLRAHADQMRNGPSAKRQRGTLNVAADNIRDGAEPGVRRGRGVA